MTAVVPRVLIASAAAFLSLLLAAGAPRPASSFTQVPSGRRRHCAARLRELRANYGGGSCEEKEEENAVGRSRRALLLDAAALVSPSILLLGGGGVGGLVTVAAATAASPSPANAVYNPLNLKGTYWETGKLYTKPPPAELPSDPYELLQFIEDAAATLESSSLSTAVEDGRFDEASRLLRGGAVSESTLRITGNALIDVIVDETQSYVAADKFRTFLRDFDFLDASVTAAMRRSAMDGGLVSTVVLGAVAPLSAASRVASIAHEPSMLGGDARLEVLGALQGCVKSLRSFAKVVEKALKEQQ